MSRRPGADRHVLLGASAYPRSHASAPQRGPSPFEQPYASSSSLPYGGSSGAGSSHHGGADEDMYAEYGAPKKEYAPPTQHGGGRWSAAERTALDLEEQNEAHIEGLGAKVRLLKEITLGIGQEVRDGTAEMSTLSEAFSTTSAYLGGTFRRMNAMAKRQRGWGCNMFLFVLLCLWIFVFLWWWRR